jgi:hypothetical protein
MTLLETDILEVAFARRRHKGRQLPRRFRHVSMAALQEDYSDFTRKGRQGVLRRLPEESLALKPPARLNPIEITVDV